MDNKFQTNDFSANSEANNTAEHHRRMWRSIRILRRFSTPVLLQTTPGITCDTARQFVQQLISCGHIEERGAIGDDQGYVLLNDIGPMPPPLYGN